MEMEKGRRLLFALIATAVMLNIGYGLANNGIKLPIIKKTPEFKDNVIEEEDFTVTGLNGGSSFTSNYNMTLDVDLDEEDGRYTHEGILVRTVGEGSLDKSLTGTYTFIHSKNETQDISFRGFISSSRITDFDENGLPIKESSDSSITFSGPKGFGSSSSVSTTIEQFRGLRTDLIWKALVPSGGILRSNSSGKISVAVDLQEAGMNCGKVMINWNMISIEESPEGSVATLHCFTDLSNSVSMEMKLEFLEGCGWPRQMDLNVETSIITEDGPADVRLSIDETLQSHTRGSEDELPFIIYDPLGPPAPLPDDGGYLLPQEGGETCFRSLPEEVLDICLSEGTILSDHIDSRGFEGLSLKEGEYYRIDNADPQWVWNITLSSKGDSALFDTYTFEVGVEGGGIIGQRRFQLLSESKGQSLMHPDSGRPLISLASNEMILKGSDIQSHFFRGEEYSSSYRLDILRRGTTACDMGSLMFMNLLGVERAQVTDLFISSAIDRKDPSKMHLAVIDGRTGDLISTTEFEGAFVPLFNSYGFELA
jgi:hypothetical protein